MGASAPFFSCLIHLNLSVHLRKLEEAGFVAVTKSFQGRKPLTRAAMTEAGRDAFLAYLDAMSALVAGR